MAGLFEEIVHRFDREAILSPSFTSWRRLEPLPITTDLAASLAAEVADPLWLLARQWQLGEFRGEDAGSPISVHVAGEAAPLSRFHPGPIGDDPAGRAVDMAGLPAPLEVVVEQEPVVARHERIAAATGLQFVRFLEAEGADALAASFAAAYPLSAATDADDEETAAWRAIAAGRVPDGAALADALGPHRGTEELTGLPADPGVPADRRDAVRRAGGRWLAWYDALIDEPSTDEPPPSWRSDRLEYAFAAQATFTNGDRIVLRADEYTDGRVDWYSFDADTGTDLGPPASAPAVTPLDARLLPTQVRYPGMPADRYWEVEDGRVSFAAIPGGPGDLARMLLLEFALVFGNDWYIVPVDLPVGSVFRWSRFQVTDTFGEVQDVPASRHVRPAGGATPWRMFTLDPRAGAAAWAEDVALLPPVLPVKLTGDPIESVAFVRDELANMVWAIERTVASPAGDPIDRHEEPGARVALQTVTGDIGDAELVYRLATPVPVHWIPFVPVPVAGGGVAVELERRAMVRSLPGAPAQTIEPRGRILGPAGMRIAEEEVPRSGVVVERVMQQARWHDGRTHVWLGRHKRAAGGEASSGLRWDVAEPGEAP